MRQLSLYFFALCIAGCATVSPSIPENYSGPKAILEDTGRSEGGSKAMMFVALEIDGQTIQNSLRATRNASYGKGFALTTLYTTREVPARSMKLKLSGTHVTAAPIHEIASRAAGTFFSIEGEVTFSPESGRTYFVTGELTKERSCVWIEDRSTNKLVVEKICTK